VKRRFVQVSLMMILRDWFRIGRSSVTLKLIIFQPCIIVVIIGQVPLRVVCALVVTVV